MQLPRQGYRIETRTHSIKFVCMDVSFRKIDLNSKRQTGSQNQKKLKQTTSSVFLFAWQANNSRSARKLVVFFWDSTRLSSTMILAGTLLTSSKNTITSTIGRQLKTSSPFVWTSSRERFPPVVHLMRVRVQRPLAARVLRRGQSKVSMLAIARSHPSTTLTKRWTERWNSLTGSSPVIERTTELSPTGCARRYLAWKLSERFWISTDDHRTILRPAFQDLGCRAWPYGACQFLTCLCRPGRLECTGATGGSPLSAAGRFFRNEKWLWAGRRCFVRLAMVVKTSTSTVVSLCLSRQKFCAFPRLNAVVVRRQMPVLLSMKTGVWSESRHSSFPSCRRCHGGKL